MSFSYQGDQHYYNHASVYSDRPLSDGNDFEDLFDCEYSNDLLNRYPKFNGTDILKKCQKATNNFESIVKIIEFHGKLLNQRV